MCEASEAVLVQELVPDAAVEALGKRVLDWLARSDEVVLDPMRVAPSVERSARELWAIVRPDSARLPIRLDGPVQDSSHSLCWQGHVEFHGHAAP
jgi:hypothetical protein